MRRATNRPWWIAPRLPSRRWSTSRVSEDPRKMLGRARAVMICPRVFKAGFFFGGEGGACVLLARAGNGTWSYPAFYGMGSGSFGLPDRHPGRPVRHADHDREGAARDPGQPVQVRRRCLARHRHHRRRRTGIHHGAFGADIVAFSQTRGLYGGVSIEGSLMGQKSEWNRAYYGREMGSQQIVIDMQATNPGADPLRDVLTRFGTAASRSRPRCRRRRWTTRRLRRPPPRRRSCSRADRCSSRTCRRRGSR